MADDDLEYKAFVQGLPCCACHAPAPSDIHHHTSRRGHGQRASDRDGMPLCRRHHDQFHEGSGMFKGWEAEQRRAWQSSMVDKTRALHAQINDPEVF